MIDIHGDFFLYSSIVSDIKYLSVRERERGMNRNSATLSVLLNPNLSAVWKENFFLCLSSSDYHHRFLIFHFCLLLLPCSLVLYRYKGI